MADLSQANAETRIRVRQPAARVISHRVRQPAARVISHRDCLRAFLDSMRSRQACAIYGLEQGNPVTTIAIVNSIEVESGSGKSFNIGTADSRKIFVETD
jgi:hypothetical protein